METRHWIIRGKVQGVGFRFHTVEAAQKLTLKGWVRNLTTGEVEIVAQGNPNELDKLHQWLHQGSPSAEVQQVIANTIPHQALSPFQAKPTASQPQSF